MRQGKTTPLYEKHLEAGARIIDFAGWRMPVQYSGIIAEHTHTRLKAGLFDTSHMGELRVSGRGAPTDLERLVTCRLEDLPVDVARYGFLLNEAGGILDDLIVYRTSSDEFLLVVNASNRDKDREWIQDRLSGGSHIEDESEQTAMLSLQGPLSAQVLDSLFESKPRPKLKRFSFVRLELFGSETMISRTGYTGEMGFELFCSGKAAQRLWDAILATPDVMPVGLGARDTLRLEKGYPLYGNDLDEGHTPVEANLQRFLFMEKPFIGRDAILERGEPSRVLTGFRCEGRQAARQHFPVHFEGRLVGEVTSGAFSPLLKRSIGLCYIERDRSREGTEISIKRGSTEIRATIQAPPLYP
jgi:aminomethyltransferase